MALNKANDMSVVPAGNTVQTKQKKTVKVLDEETYTKNVEDIIERDFYPDLPSLKEKSEYFEAVEKNDLVKLREFQMKKISRQATGSSTTYTPATFETPGPDDNRQKSPPKDKSHDQEEEEHEATNSQKSERQLQSLDKYFSKNTSEDNASFSEILAETQKKHREKHAWLYENEDTRKQEEEDRLALPSIEQQAAIADKPAGVDSWKYQTRNSLMYVPDGEEFSAKELVELQKAKVREIVHENTRFHSNPWNQSKSKEQIKQAATMKAFTTQGKIGHDGKEVVIPESPQVNGYGFVATPSPAPGVEESPLMTWGEIEGTPFRLEGSDTPVAQTPGPLFRIPDVPKRDMLAMELAEKASKAHRDKKEKALKSVQARLATPSPKFGRTPTERINSMSPAAQRLARLRNRSNTDQALRASYTPSPSHRLTGNKTPLLTPRLTPKSGSSTPSGERTPGSKRVASSDISSLTDNLLKLPKRQKAADFF